MKQIVWILLIIPLGIQAQIIDSSKWQIKNMNINTSADEYLFFSLDTMNVFTSNRSHESSSNLTVNTEQSYQCKKGKNDTIYSANRSMSFVVNRENNAAIVGVDSQYCYIRKSCFPDEGEIFLSKRSEKNLTKTKGLTRFTWNSPADESTVATRKDEVFFISNRDGSYDIWSSRNGSSPTKSDDLNSSSDEQDVWLNASGDSLFFSSNRPGGKGGYDNYLSVWTASTWSTPINLWWLNTTSDDRDLHWYGTKGYFSSTRSGGKGGFDLYEITQLKQETPPQDTIQQDTLKKDAVKVDTVKIISPPSIIILTPRQKTEKKTSELLGIPKDSLKLRNQYAAHTITAKTITDFVKAYRIQTSIDSFIVVNDKGLYRLVDIYIVHVMDEVVSTRDVVMKQTSFPIDPQHCPFIEVLNESDHRYAIIVYTQYEGKEAYGISQDGVEIWRSDKD